MSTPANRPIRTALFWIHLVAGVAAGLVILVMSATGALLAFQPQILAFIDRDIRVVAPQPGQPRLATSDLLARVAAEHPELHVSGITIDADPAASVQLTVDRSSVYVDPYSGRVLGSPSAKAQQVFRAIENWHRWLAMSGDTRDTGRALTGASNLAFLFLAGSGLVLWWPRRLTVQHLKPIVWFRRAGTAKARDFNWHNVIGFWSAPVLIVLTLTGVVMSYPWANGLLFSVAGGSAPAGREGARDAARPGGPGGGPGARREPGTGAAPATPESVDLLVASAMTATPRWTSIALRWPSRPGAPTTLSVAGVSAWNAVARSQYSLDTTSGAIVNAQPYAATALAPWLRGLVRFGHTGEVGGWPGQLLAGAASLGGAVLVWTGLSLAVRRLLALVRRPARTATSVQNLAPVR
ncbi:MAG: PepSY-associated TM helix domain-containing protein [Vicinamibacterales bacterium]